MASTAWQNTISLPKFFSLILVLCEYAREMKIFFLLFIFCSSTFANVQVLSPTVKLRAGRNTKFTVNKEASVVTSIKLSKGVVRVMSSSEFAVKGPDVTFTTKDAEFEVAIFKHFVDVNVIRGEVEASSPHIQTFVPEIINAQEGFRYSRTERKFLKGRYVLFLK